MHCAVGLRILSVVCVSYLLCSQSIAGLNASSSALGCVSQTLVLRQGPVCVAQVVLKILLPVHSNCYLILQKDNKKSFRIDSEETRVQWHVLEIAGIETLSWVSIN